MKKILLTLIAFVGVLTASAAVETTTFYEENFIDMSVDNDYPVDGWLTYGNGVKPEGKISQGYFDPEGKGPYYCLLNAGADCFAMANTQFEGDAEPDEWLVTPEIEIKYDNAVLSFTAAAYAANGALPFGVGSFKVLLSEGGSAQEDFTTTLLKRGTVSSKDDTEIVTKQLAIQVNGYKGKKVRFAFVVNSPNVGFIGFTNFALSQYAFTLVNYTKNVVEIGSPATIDINTGLKTPVKCSAVKAELKINGEKVLENIYDKKTFGSSTSTSIIYTRMNFKEVAVVETTDPLNYEVIITPDFEGAIPTVVSGSIGAAEHTYIQNVVVEEVTATGCQACPAGMAALEYYHEMYPGTETQGKVIEIGIHGYVNRTDPMASGNEVYLTNLMGLTGTTTYPQAAFNREVRGVMPHEKSELEKLIAGVAYNSAKITKVSCVNLEEGQDIWGTPVKVEFDVTNGFSTVSRDLSAAIVLVENDVKGFNSSYNQTNGFAKQGESYIKGNYGEYLVPYMKKYLQGGELGYEEIPFNLMTYNHVARGIYPNFYGSAIAKQWTSGVAQSFEKEFNVPETVMNFDNTQVILLIIDGENNKIVASDIMSAKDFVKVESGVEEIAASNVAVANNGGVLNVKAQAGSVVDAYSIDGKHLGNYVVENGVLSVATDWNGAVIVKVSGAENKVAKLIF